jgi:hypothetical protein
MSKAKQLTSETASGLATETEAAYKPTDKNTT